MTQAGHKVNKSTKEKIILIVKTVDFYNKNDSV